jgi:hypothetical protein
LTAHSYTVAITIGYLSFVLAARPMRQGCCQISTSPLNGCRVIFTVCLTCTARNRERPLSEMDPASIQINPHHVCLWSCSVCTLALQAFPCHPASCNNQNTVVVAATTVMSRAALGTTLIPTPARPLPTPLSAIYNYCSDRCNRGANFH